MFSRGCCPWKAAPMGHMSISPGKRPHLAQLSREVLWLSLSVSLCDSPTLPVLMSTDPTFLPAPSSQGNQQPTKAFPASWTHPGAAQAHFSSSTCAGHHSPSPGNSLGAGDSHSHTHTGSHQSSRPGSQQAILRMLRGQNQLKAD